MPLTVVDSAGQTEIGHVRQSNEDSCLIRGVLFMVADGMGGAAAGEIASTMCAEAFAEVDLIRTRGADALRQAVTTANRRIHERAVSDPAVAGMGTTVTAALVGQDGGIDFANVGDSRAYLLRGGELQQLTEDHSMVAELVAAGQISEDEAAVHPQRNVVTRVLGAEPTVLMDGFQVEGQDGDIVLLCSDGLTSTVSAQRILELLTAAESAEEAVRALARAALDGGGDDNVTVLVFRLGESDDVPSAQFHGTILTRDPDLEPPDDEPRPGISKRRLLVRVGAVMAVVALLGVGAVAGLRESHFVGANESTGRIEVYQGIPVELTGTITLYHAVYASPVTYASLDPQTRKELFDHELRSYEGAREAVRRIEEGIP